MGDLRVFYFIRYSISSKEGRGLLITYYFVQSQTQHFLSKASIVENTSKLKHKSIDRHIFNTKLKNDFLHAIVDIVGHGMQYSMSFQMTCQNIGENEAFHRDVGRRCKK